MSLRSYMLLTVFVFILSTSDCDKTFEKLIEDYIIFAFNDTYRNQVYKPENEYSEIESTENALDSLLLTFDVANQTMLDVSNNLSESLETGDFNTYRNQFYKPENEQHENYSTESAVDSLSVTAHVTSQAMLQQGSNLSESLGTDNSKDTYRNDQYKPENEHHEYYSTESAVDSLSVTAHVTNQAMLQQGSSLSESLGTDNSKDTYRHEQYKPENEHHENYSTESAVDSLSVTAHVTNQAMLQQGSNLSVSLGTGDSNYTYRNKMWKPENGAYETKPTVSAVDSLSVTAHVTNQTVLHEISSLLKSLGTDESSNDRFDLNRYIKLTLTEPSIETVVSVINNKSVKNVRSDHARIYSASSLKTRLFDEPPKFFNNYKSSSLSYSYPNLSKKHSELKRNLTSIASSKLLKSSSRKVPKQSEKFIANILKKIKWVPNTSIENGRVRNETIKSPDACISQAPGSTTEKYFTSQNLEEETLKSAIFKRSINSNTREYSLMSKTSDLNFEKGQNYNLNISYFINNLSIAYGNLTPANDEQTSNIGTFTTTKLNGNTKTNLRNRILYQNFPNGLSKIIITNDQNSNQSEINRAAHPSNVIPEIKLINSDLKKREFLFFFQTNINNTNGIFSKMSKSEDIDRKINSGNYTHDFIAKKKASVTSDSSNNQVQRVLNDRKITLKRSSDAVKAPRELKSIASASKEGHQPPRLHSVNISTENLDEKSSRKLWKRNSRRFTKLFHSYWWFLLGLILELIIILLFFIVPRSSKFRRKI